MKEVVKKVRWSEMWALPASTAAREGVLFEDNLVS